MLTNTDNGSTVLQADATNSVQALPPVTDYTKYTTYWYITARGPAKNTP